MQLSTLIAMLGAVLAVAGPIRVRNNSVYATFYDDTACTQNQGEAVSTSNPGCLNESGRNSIYFQTGETDNSYNLIYSPSQNCPCQSYCNAQIVGATQLPACISLAGTPSAESYRFIDDTSPCPADNC